MFELDPVETRIVGCLLEKQRTTPDAYPLTLNALRIACNQSTNRDPVMDLEETEIQEALQRLHRREVTRVASGHGSRSSKYRHLLAETLGLAEDESALICVLLLRGDQTPGELKQRTERMYPFADLTELDETLARLVERELVFRLERRPGEKQVRYRQLMSTSEDAREETADGSDEAPDGESRSLPPEIRQSSMMAGLSAQTSNGVGVEIARLREAMESLSREVAELRQRVEGQGGGES